MPHPRSFRRPMPCVALLAGWVLLSLPRRPPRARPALAANASAAVDAASLSLDDREKFLAAARIVNERPAPKGTTNTRRVTLSDGTIDARRQRPDHRGGACRLPVEPRHRAQLQGQLALQRGRLRIDRLLSLGMIPATVERRHNGKPGSFTWWVDDVLMDEQERYRQKKQVPNTNDWNEQMWITRLFDQLIANVDRNLGNLLIDKAYNIWMIDHSRSFRLNTDLRSPENLSRVDRALLDRLRQLDRDGLKRAAGDYLTDGEIDALLNRRDRIVAHFDKGGPTLVFDRRARCC